MYNLQKLCQEGIKYLVEYELPLNYLLHDLLRVIPWTLLVSQL